MARDTLPRSQSHSQYGATETMDDCGGKIEMDEMMDMANDIEERMDDGLLKLKLLNDNDNDNDNNNNNNNNSTNSDDGTNNLTIVQLTVYAAVNLILSVPSLYGYAAVIFSHPIYDDHMSALSKLVIFSSAIHQITLTCRSTLPFAIGTVQDAGLIFLSAMSRTIADTILDSGGDSMDVVSTACVILPLGTAALGLVLLLMGACGAADSVSYLPLPAIGGYLAFIGYFCVEAGVGLCVSCSIENPSDWWPVLTDGKNLMLMAPGLVAGVVMTVVSRRSDADVTLPAVMIMIPALFYVCVMIFYGFGSVGLVEARDAGWVGDVSDPVPISSLLDLVDWNRVRWDVIPLVLPTWAGMVFVVSFASCLDVAAISMDMGEPLDANRELATVGLSNLASGLTFGFTGSYIFSQTIFTCRAGVRSRLVGIIVAIGFITIVLLPHADLLSICPLFFLGSTLIFIGYDLLYEWIVEVRHRLLFAEYLVLWVTFISIHIVGIDAGIVLGATAAAVDHVFTSARTSSLRRVNRRSRAIWTPDDWRLLQDGAYDINNPRIITLEVGGSIFFGSSQKLLDDICSEISLEMVPLGTDNADTGRNNSNNGKDNELDEKDLLMSPHRSSYLLSSPSSSTPIGSTPMRRRIRTKPPTDRRNQDINNDQTNKNLTTLQIQSQQKPLLPSRPDYLVLDLSSLSNLDASAARGCFLRLARACGRAGTLVCASGAPPRVEWMLRSHSIAYDVDEEMQVRKGLLEEQRKKGRDGGRGGGSSSSRGTTNSSSSNNLDRLLLFETVFDALEFCEDLLIGGGKMQGSLSPRQYSHLSPNMTASHPVIPPHENVNMGTRSGSFIRLDEACDDDLTKIVGGGAAQLTRTNAIAMNETLVPINPSGELSSRQKLSRILSYVLGLDKHDADLVDSMEESGRFLPHEEVRFTKGEYVFRRGEVRSDAFYVVLRYVCG